MENKNQNKDYLYKIRHSAEHIMNQAIEELWPNQIKRAIGPAIEDGFYNDSRWEGVKITEEDFPKIEAKMQEIVDKNLPFTYKEISEQEALKMFENNPFKQELIKEFAEKGEKLSIYITGTEDSSEFIDLCKGPHVERTGEVKAFKLLSVAGAYWRGSEKNEMLTRIYGTAFPSKKELEEHLTMLEEAKKRDHKKLGKELELFMFHETAPGIPYWLPKGLTIYNELVNFWRIEHKERGYQEIASPLINKKELWECSGHWDHYKEDMFIADMGENEVYGIKPMNCPNAMIVFGSKTRSYKDLPLRLSDTDMLHRYERSGTLNGLLRARSFRQDDSHNFITHDQIKSEYAAIFEIANKFYGIFDLKFRFRLGTRPESFIGDIETWNKAESQLKEILEESGREYFIEEGDGAFYGPKVDILMKDSIGRDWQMGTIQLDFQLPRRFNLSYIDSDGKEQTPVVVHRVIYGSLERFMGILTEHTAGAFPLWLAPIQVKIIPISDKFNDYATKISQELEKQNIRVEIDTKAETMGNKIRKAQEEKIPYMLVIGEKEVNDNKVSVRTRDGKQSNLIELEGFTQKLRTLIIGKSLICDI